MVLLNIIVTHTLAYDDTEKFLAWYWQRPLANQGQPPSHWSVLERSLHPEQCGVCHPQQFVGWQQSRHARAMGAGVMGQLLTWPLNESQVCLNCHAPLQEQTSSLISRSADRLHQQGVLCSACHVRAYQWFGPPARSRQASTSSKQAHAGWQTQNAFTDSRFCAACHQFPEEGYALNGKLLENTYREWQASPQARQQKNCQFCHMPDRQHLWRGIHDVEMVRSGVTIRLSKLRRVENLVRLSLSLQNTNIGHFFPTYVTPKVTLRIYQEDVENKLIAGTLQQRVIARDVSLDLETEYFDTRLAPNETALLDYSQPLHTRAKSLVAQIQVEPDAFYTGFYQDLLTRDLDTERLPIIRQALSESEKSIFILYNQYFDLPLLEE